VDILCTATNCEIKLIREAYKESKVPPFVIFGFVLPKLYFFKQIKR